jgi:hypothetical protein
MTDILTAAYFIVGALWTAFRIGYDTDVLLFAPLTFMFWPLDIFYGLGRGLRK